MATFRDMNPAFELFSVLTNGSEYELLSDVELPPKIPAGADIAMIEVRRNNEVMLLRYPEDNTSDPPLGRTPIEEEEGWLVRMEAVGASLHPDSRYMGFDDVLWTPQQGMVRWQKV